LAMVKLINALQQVFFNWLSIPDRL
jgi:hypothetical protein